MDYSEIVKILQEQENEDIKLVKQYYPNKLTAIVKLKAKYKANNDPINLESANAFVDEVFKTGTSNIKLKKYVRSEDCGCEECDCDNDYED